MIDLAEEDKLVYHFLNKAGVPYELQEEKFQDFAAYFYTNYNYNSEYKKSTYIRLLFGNWLSECAIKYNGRDKIMEQLSTRVEDKREDYLDWNQVQRGDYEASTEQETYLYCDSLISQLKPLTQEYLLEKAGSEKGGGRGGWGGSFLQIASKREGVTRQALEARIKRDIKKVLDRL